MIKVDWVAAGFYWEVDAVLVIVWHTVCKSTNQLDEFMELMKYHEPC
jgi:hypothetical protein